MNKLLAASVLLSSSFSAMASDTLQANYAVTAYATGILQPQIDARLHNSMNGANAKLYNYIQPAAAVSKRTKRGNYHQLELSTVSFKVWEHSGAVGYYPSTGYIYNTQYKIKAADIAVRYEFIIPFVKRNGARVIPSLGFGAMPWFSTYKFAPYTTADYPLTTSAIGVRYFVTPRVQVALSKRLFLDANIPICVANMGTTKQNIQNPSLPVNAQKYSVFDFDLMPKYHTARLGFGVKI